MKRGPKSAQDVLTVVTVSDQRVTPPDGLLTERQGKLWKQIVDSLPADFFRPGDIPLLAAYCKAWDFYLQAAASIEQTGVTFVDERGKLIANPAQSMLVTQASAMAQLAVKLRLAPSSRISPRSVGRKADQGGGARPWAAG